MGFAIFFICHFYLGIFMQTAFYHRYASHQHFTMNKFWERVFFVVSWLVHGVGYLSPTAYAVMHKLHHAFADKERDPHSSTNVNSMYQMYVETKNSYIDILKKRIPVEPYFYNNVPTWQAFDKFATTKYSRLFWLGTYIACYWFFAPSVYCWLLLPFHVLIAPITGVAINWFAHQPDGATSYTHFEQNNRSVNVLRFDFIFMGEAYHNNHHANPRSANLGYKWYEVDIGYILIYVLSIVGVTRLKKTRMQRPTQEPAIQAV
jgi:stearoyl-CoA desaturase (delta-9 desaturase)